MSTPILTEEQKGWLLDTAIQIEQYPQTFNMAISGERMLRYTDPLNSGFPACIAGHLIIAANRLEEFRSSVLAVEIFAHHLLGYFDHTDQTLWRLFAIFTPPCLDGEEVTSKNIRQRINHWIDTGE